MPDTDSQNKVFLDACTRQYEQIRETACELARTGSDELILDWIQLSANFAAMNHPGLFGDGKLENLALDVGRSLCAVEQAQTQVNHDTRRRVLHVATTVASIGGHTRTIINWIKNDSQSCHSLITTDNLGVTIPPELQHAIEHNGGRIVVQSGSHSLCDRALRLRTFAAANADLVFLHIVPHDVVPVAAFAKPGGPPVALINLADQCFWLGSTIADSVVHLRDIGASTAKQLRQTRNDLLLPIPLPANTVSHDRLRQREQLGIPATQLVLVSVGRSIKYAPTNKYNFFRTACRILNAHPDAHLYVVGVAEQDYINRVDFHSHERMHLLGPLDNATPYQQAADIYIEGFPFGSQTALLEAAMQGVPCVPAIAQSSQLLATQDSSLNGLIDTPIDEDAYVNRTCHLMAHPDERQFLGSALSQSVLEYHVGESWSHLLEEVYKSLSTLDHLPTNIDHQSPQTRTVDQAISQYHGTRLQGEDIEQMVSDQVHDAILMSVYFIRQRGYHLDSLKLLLIAHRNRPWSMESMSYLTKLLPHKLFMWIKGWLGAEQRTT